MKLIVATDLIYGIGANNTLPWKFKSDLKYFSNMTKGLGNNCIIMGKNTFLSIGKPLPKRTNIVLSTSLSNTLHDNIIIFNNITPLIHYIQTQHFDQIWIIGGLQIYQLFLEKKLIDEIYITLINNSYPSCDTFFPIELLHTHFYEDPNYTFTQKENQIDLIFKKFIRK